jgi:enamine deaminase RidA (YjgF/YER057c/UK114 family)
MKDQPSVPAPRIVRHVRDGTHVVTLTHASHQEMFITAVPVEGQHLRAMLRQIAELLRDSGAVVVSFDVFGLGGPGTGNKGAFSEVFGRVSWPLTWLGADGHSSQEVTGAQVWAVSGASVAPLKLAGRVVGSVFDVGAACYCRLAGVLPTDIAQPRAEQAWDVLERMESALEMAGLGFGDVVRTWFFNEHILDWYADFNRVRDAFFTQRGVYRGIVPASTGIGGRNAAGAALMGGLLALRAQHGGTCVAAVPSPLQPSALEYGSSFSRAVEVLTPGCRKLLVSGTASIAPNGATAHVGDIDGQITRTADVVQAILSSRGMRWADVTRGVAYFKRAEDVPVLRRHCVDRGMERLPIVCAQSTVCRDELLFELEVDAVSTT